jgi:hypothetical protein
VSIDVFNNLAQAQISSGGSTLIDTAFVAASSSLFLNTANSGALPPTQFRIVDAANPTEIMIVTNQGTSTHGANNDWTVLRAQEGTTAVVHAANWIAEAVVTGAAMDSRYGALGSSLWEYWIKGSFSPDQFLPAAASVPFANQRALQMGTPLTITDGAPALNYQIGSCYYEPGSTRSITTTGLANGTLGAMDTTNLTMAFTALSSETLIELTGLAGIYSGAGSYGWGLLDHTTGLIRGYWSEVSNGGGGVVPAKIPIRIPTAQGTSYQVDFAHGIYYASAGVGATFAGALTANPVTQAPFAPMTMRAFAQ